MNNQNQFDSMCVHSGWHSDCALSPKPDIAPAERHVAKGTGWEPCPNDRSPQEGYEYALEASSRKPGFRGVAEAVYYRRVKRLA